jgi:hypothetical protein
MCVVESPPLKGGERLLHPFSNCHSEVGSESLTQTLKRSMKQVQGMVQSDIEMMTDYLMCLYWLGVLLFPGVI